MFAKFSTVLLALTAAASVSAHGVLVAIDGDNGVKAQGFGVVESTPRDGTRRNPFQTDSSIIRDREIESGKADACGRTLAGGVNNMAAMLEAASSAGLPSAAADGNLKSRSSLTDRHADPTLATSRPTLRASRSSQWRSPPMFPARTRAPTQRLKISRWSPGCPPAHNALAAPTVMRASSAAATPLELDPSEDVRPLRTPPPRVSCLQRDVSLEEADAALAEDLERRDVSLEEADAALAEDLERRSFNKKRYLKTRVAGAKAGYWI